MRSSKEHVLKALLFINLWLQAFEQFGIEVFEYLDADPWVVCDVRWFAEGRGSAVGVDLRQADAYELMDGKIIRAVLAYPDAATALTAVQD